MNDELFQQNHRWMRQDIEGVSSAKKVFSSNDRRAEKILQSTTTKVEGRYQIGLLWKENVDLPNNRWVAERQLSGLEQRLEQDSNLKQLYQKTVDDDLAKGYIVRVPPNDTTVKKWYLPHHTVTNIHKPAKVRRVTNASSVFKGKSLNSSLLTGPDFLCNLTGLILRFRLHRVAISANIEAMFMQVLVDPNDRPFLRFLWRNNKTMFDYEYTRHIFGATDSPCVACYAVVTVHRQAILLLVVESGTRKFRCLSVECLFVESGIYNVICQFCTVKGMVVESEILKAQSCALSNKACLCTLMVQCCANDNADDHPDIPAIVQRNIYMDDLYLSLPTDEEATDTAQILRTVLSTGGFNLTKWSSNSRNFLKGLNSELRAAGADPDNSLTPQRVLGMPWDPEKDVYFIPPDSYQNVKDIQTPSQRSLLKFTSSIFDPLGLTAPLTIRLRICMQLAWTTGQHWDKPIPEEHLADFHQWTSEIDHFRKIELHRQLHNYKSQPKRHELHVFSDASGKAFSAVSDLRTIHDDNHISIDFLIGKARVAPIKRLTIPNLELQAATIGSRLAVYIKEELDIRIAKTFMWTDSTTVLHWINNTHQRHKIFVANRLNIILDSTDASDWRYVPTSDNPADEGTRGYTASQMNVNSRWIQGPPFLSHNEHFWPAQPTSSQQVTVSLTHQPTDQHEKPLFEITRFSNWNRLIRTIAFCFLVADRARNRQATLTLEHITKAFKFLIKSSQQHSFLAEMKELSKKNCLPANSRISQLSPFIDEHGILRSRVRLAKATVILCSRFPVILDAACPSIELFLQHIHSTNGYCGLEFSRAVVQQQFWILKARKVLRQLIRRCITCR